MGILDQHANHTAPHGGQLRQSFPDALFTKTQQRLLSLLFGQADRSFFVTELIELAGSGRGTVQRELSRLEAGGLVTTKKRGNQKHYQANARAPIFDELCSIVKKTLGVEQRIRNGLLPVADLISVAFVYGSLAQQTDSASSDVDLLIVSDSLSLEEVYALLEPLEHEIGRQISPTLYTSDEFEHRRSNANPFLTRVLAGPIELVAGSFDGA